MNSTTSDYQKAIAISGAVKGAAKKNSFVLTRKNQKGQVAIFVALIFQVVFVFFALMINVGLLVHHKINLQHSTDLAAYYGAMKEAEQLNAIAHINFQMRQAWKLLTWRYRVLGTFGFIKSSNTGVINQNFPFENVGGNTFSYNGSLGIFPSQMSPYTNGGPSFPPQPVMNCAPMVATDPDYSVDGTAIGIQDIPFFCPSHPGFKTYPQSESYCQLHCGLFTSARTISLIPSLGTTFTTPFGGDLADTVNGTIDNVNNQITDRCDRLGPLGAATLARFMASYSGEQYARRETIKALAKNLSLDSESMLDIEGQPVKLGAKRTFENNLTGANFSGLEGDASFQVYNGYGSSDCRFRNGDPDDGRQFLKRIDFKIISYFLLNCRYSGTATIYEPQGVYTDAGLGSAFNNPRVPSELREAVENLMNPQNLHTIGYEKNPHCVDYYAVKSYSNPTIPFLPLGKIRLEAVAIAKPFGGSIGPWYGTKWDVSDPKSQYNDSLPDTKMDPTLPMRDYIGEPNARLIRSVYSQPNFSLFVGDRLGLRNLDYLAAFHSALAMRDINEYPGTNSSSAVNTQNKLLNPSAWPDYSNWNDTLNFGGSDFRTWDSLATEKNDPATGVSQGGMRALEIAAIAPNQFDVFHYSIDPDFYNNYYIKLYKGFDNIKSAVGGSAITKDQIRPDFGARDVDDFGGASPPMALRTFSVKDQILLKNQVLDVRPRFFGTGPGTRPPGANGDTYGDFMNFLVSAQSSLLTSWTFLRFNDYLSFPGGAVNKLDNTMSFGQCDDQWNKTANAIGGKTNPQNFETPMSVNADYPPTSGNCVTGGRTGYSVKIIAPTQVDGSDTNLPIVNPIDPTFLQF